MLYCDHFSITWWTEDLEFINFSSRKSSHEKTVQTQKATTGTIEKTVEGSGSVKATTQNVTFSSDVTVQSVLKKTERQSKKEM